VSALVTPSVVRPQRVENGVKQNIHARLRKRSERIPQTAANGTTEDAVTPIEWIAETASA